MNKRVLERVVGDEGDAAVDIRDVATDSKRRMCQPAERTNTRQHRPAGRERAQGSSLNDLSRRGEMSG